MLKVYTTGVSTKDETSETIVRNLFDILSYIPLGCKLIFLAYLLVGY